MATCPNCEASERACHCQPDPRVIARQILAKGEAELVRECFGPRVEHGDGGVAIPAPPKVPDLRAFLIQHSEGDPVVVHAPDFSRAVRAFVGFLVAENPGLDAVEAETWITTVSPISEVPALIARPDGWAFVEV